MLSFEGKVSWGTLEGRTSSERPQGRFVLFCDMRKVLWMEVFLAPPDFYLLTYLEGPTRLPEPQFHLSCMSENK